MRSKTFDIKALCDVVSAQDMILFVKLSGSKLFRVAHIPERYDTKEVREVLVTLCKKYYKGIFYFHLPDVQDTKDVCEVLYYMDIEHYMVYSAQDPELCDNPTPTPEEMN